MSWSDWVDGYETVYYSPNWQYLLMVGNFFMALVFGDMTKQFCSTIFI